MRKQLRMSLQSFLFLNFQLKHYSFLTTVSSGLICFGHGYLKQRGPVSVTAMRHPIFQSVLFLYLEGYVYYYQTVAIAGHCQFNWENCWAGQQSSQIHFYIMKLELIIHPDINLYQKMYLVLIKSWQALNTQHWSN